MPTPTQNADAVLKIVPRIMRAIRNDMRRFRDPRLSVPQFRTLGFVHRHAGTSLSPVADHIGLTLPAMSRLVNGLVRRRFLVRRRLKTDRRQITLGLTPTGRAAWTSARAFTQAALAHRLSILKPAEQVAVARALDILGRLFAGEPQNPE